MCNSHWAFSCGVAMTVKTLRHADSARCCCALVPVLEKFVLTPPREERDGFLQNVPHHFSNFVLAALNGLLDGKMRRYFLPS
jgi:hypothetical protein